MLLGKSQNGLIGYEAQKLAVSLAMLVLSLALATHASLLATYATPPIGNTRYATDPIQLSRLPTWL